MADSPLPSAPEAPTDQDELDVWLEDRSITLGNKLGEALTRIVVDTANAYLDTVVAAGDSAVFDEIPSRWRATVQSVALTDISGVYLSGSVNAFVLNPLSGDIPQTLLEQWVGVVNTESLDYLTTASNRLVGIGDDVWGNIRDKVSSVVETGATRDELRRQIQDIANVNARRAETIARTEINAAYLNGQRVATEALGAEYGPVEKKWRATMDDRTRDSHITLDDVVVPYDDFFVTINGEALIGPHDPNGDPSEVVNCRCRQIDLYVGDRRPDGTIVGTDALSDESRAWRDIEDRSELPFFDPWANYSG
jgi:hypothetical protein